MNKRQYQIIALTILTIVGLLFWHWQRTERSPLVQTVHAFSQHSIAQKAAPAQSTKLPLQIAQPLQSAELEREKRVWNLGLITPIRFFGKVSDEKGAPIEGATVHISMYDHIWKGDSKSEVLTDAAGGFSVTGHGLGLGVIVSKTGFYSLPQSRGAFGYAEGAGTGAPHPDPSNPALFMLRRMGKVEPLIVRGIGGRLAKDGTLMEVNLQSGKKVPKGQGDLTIECWTADQNLAPNSSAQFDWRCRISASGGGLIERAGEFDFEAPPSGYQESVEINMPKSLGYAWRDSVTKNYFVKLPNGTYARIGLEMNAGGAQTFPANQLLESATWFSQFGVRSHAVTLVPLQIAVMRPDTAFDADWMSPAFELSPVTSKCTTAGRFKMYHPGGFV